MKNKMHTPGDKGASLENGVLLHCTDIPVVCDTDTRVARGSLECI